MAFDLWVQIADAAVKTDREDEESQKLQRGFWLVREGE